MSDWKLIDNPAYAGKSPPPEPLTESGCHDHSHFVTVQCSCGEQMHLHQTQWQLAHGQPIGSRCHACSKLLVFPPGFFDDALDEMRTSGWIA